MATGSSTNTSCSPIGERKFMVLNMEKIRNMTCPPFYWARWCVRAVLWDVLTAMETLEYAFQECPPECPSGQCLLENMLQNFIIKIHYIVYILSNVIVIKHIVKN